MAGDDLRPSQDPELRELQGLARRGRDLLEDLAPDHAERLWDGIRQTASAVPDDAGTTLPTAAARRPAGRWAPLALAAAIALVVGVGLGTVLDLRGDSAPSEPVVLASIELDPLADGVEPRTASLRQAAGQRTITVELDGLPPTDGFHEVWLLDPGTGALVSLGPVRADAVYAVPSTVDLVDLSVLDVSAEPQDGDPTHSGESLLRGEVRWTG